MASKGQVGLRIDVSRVPLREPGMEPFEIMVSESQERMLCVVAPEHLAQVRAVCDRWETNHSVIGHVVAGDRLQVYDGEQCVGDMPVVALVDDCPLYDLEPEPPAQPLYGPEPAVLAGEQTPPQTLLALLQSSNICSRRSVFEQYDCIVQSRTVKRPEEADAAVLQLEGGGAIAISIDCNGRRVACDPRQGTREAVYECAANLACVGAAPLGLTNCLNFGNPEKPHVAWQLTEAVEGLAQACEELGVPVVGGNVSLYNESPSGPIYPTPVIGMVGSLPDANQTCGLAFQNDGDVIALIGDFRPSLTGSELAKLRGAAPAGPLAPIEASAVRDAQDRVRTWVREGALHSVHDIAEGGVATAVAECCIAGQIGATLDVDLEDEELLFGEAAGTAFIVSGPAETLDGHTIIGRVGGDTLLGVPLSELAKAHANALVR
jgi:phosphoribosylformylglycinamidine synthase